MFKNIKNNHFELMGSLEFPDAPKNFDYQMFIIGFISVNFKVTHFIS